MEWRRLYVPPHPPHARAISGRLRVQVRWVRRAASRLTLRSAIIPEVRHLGGLRPRGPSALCLAGAACLAPSKDGGSAGVARESASAGFKHDSPPGVHADPLPPGVYVRATALTCGALDAVSAYGWALAWPMLNARAHNIASRLPRPDRRIAYLTAPREVAGAGAGSLCAYLYLHNDRFRVRAEYQDFLGILLYVNAYSSARSDREAVSETVFATVANTQPACGPESQKSRVDYCARFDKTSRLASLILSQALGICWLNLMVWSNRGRIRRVMMSVKMSREQLEFWRELLAPFPRMR